MIFSEATWQAVSPSHLAEAVIPASSFSLSPSSLRWGNRHFAQAFHRKALAGNFSEYIADLARAVVIGGSSNEELQELAEKVIGFGATSGADALAGFLTSCFSTVDFPFE